MLKDLNIEPNSIPLLAGEMLQQDQGGICWGMNSIIATLPYYIPDSYTISSKECTGNGIDGFHFSTVGARELGKRYGLQMLSISKTYNTIEGQTVHHLSIDSPNFTLLTGTSKRIPLTAVFVDGHSQDICYRASYEISNPEAVRITNGFIETLKDGAAVITASYKGALGEQKQVTFNVNATTFPLTNQLLNPNIFATGSFDETTSTLKTGQWGFGGWQYEGIDLSGFNYVVARLGSDNNSDVEFRLFDANNYWGSSTSSKFGNNREVTVNLKTAKKADGTALDPSHIYIAGFWSNGSSSFIVDKVYLSNTLTGIDNIQDNTSEPAIVNVYTISGVRIRTQVKREQATLGLPNGMYIVGINKIMVINN